jgi:tRNA dimethylallyltransferase
MDIGTAKPTAAEQAAVSHYGLDLVAPDERYSAAAFKDYAARKIYDIAEQGNVPMLVGGTGLYVDAVIYDYQFRAPADLALRAELEGLDAGALQDKLLGMGLPLPENDKNPRHLIRAIETSGQTAGRSELRPWTLLLGMTADRETLRERILQRVDAMVEAGLVDEVRRVSGQYGWECEALRAPGYKALRGYLEGAASLEEAKAAFVQNDMDLAKRQRTWFKRNKSIHWLFTEDKLAEAVDIATTFLNK